jgi:hypothetical protein
VEATSAEDNLAEDYVDKEEEEKIEEWDEGDKEEEEGTKDKGPKIN